MAVVCAAGVVGAVAVLSLIGEDRMGLASPVDAFAGESCNS